MLDDTNIKSLKELITPIELMEHIPLTQEAKHTVFSTRAQAKRIVRGEDDRLLVILGPCSIHNRQAALEYGQLLKASINTLKDELCIVMRVYFEKPRTCIGWTGLINDPDLDGSFHINQGLKIARQLLLDLNHQGIPTATEFLDTIIPQFISDLISWGAIGARTTESQIHRALASGLSMPIGFKNGTRGNIDIAVDAVRAAGFAHHFLGITKSGKAAIACTRGNDACHVILRGSTQGTNYDAKSVQNVVFALEQHRLRPRVMVDCSHGNSCKQPENQIKVADELCNQIRIGSPALLGIMLESHLIAGNQPFHIGMKPKYNQSITDGCLAWKHTQPILEKLAEAVKYRRKTL